MSQENNTIEEYDAILAEVRGLMVAKNADYGDSWREMRLPSITDQILVKAYRIRSIEESEGSPKVSEGIGSEYRDILNYCVFALIKLRDEKNGMSDSILYLCREFIVASSGTIAFSSEIAMPLNPTAECAEPRRWLKKISKLHVLRGDSSLDVQTVPHQRLFIIFWNGIGKPRRAQGTQRKQQLSVPSVPSVVNLSHNPNPPEKLKRLSQHHNCRIRMIRHGVTISKGVSIAPGGILRERRTGFDTSS